MSEKELNELMDDSDLPRPRHPSSGKRVPSPVSRRFFEQGELCHMHGGIDETVAAGHTSLIEILAPIPMRVERIFFEHPIQYVQVRFGRSPRPGREVEYTQFLPIAWFCGAGKDLRLGQPVSVRSLHVHDVFYMELRNLNGVAHRVLGVISGNETRRQM